MDDDLRKRIDTARGRKKADIVLRGGNLVNVFSGEVYGADVAISGGKAAGIGKYEARQVIDVSSRFILPGFIDSHVHIESSLLTPAEFARAVLPHGTTAVIADPHEIANVLGKAGIEYMLEASEGLPVDFYFMLPSCVPATPLETSGARLRARDLVPFLKHPRVLGLAEMMNYPGVLNNDREVIAKLKAFAMRNIDGHAPGLTGRDLTAYAAAGISSDHESVSAAEALEKIRAGMTVFIREGSAAKNMEALLPAVTSANSQFFTLATDDFQPGDLKSGSINELLRKAVRLGIDPVTAVRMATLNPARHFGLKNKGAVLPGYDADMVVVDDLKNFRVDLVIKAGKVAVRNGVCVLPCRRSRHKAVRNTIRTGSISPKDIAIRAESDRARIIGLIPDQIETRSLIENVSVRDGQVVSDTKHDILKLVVIERHRKRGNRGLGLVKGLQLREGALAGTVAHDSHNIIAAGVADDDILCAVDRVRKLQGGLVVAVKKRVIAEIALPVAGLMSDRPLGFVVKALERIDRAVRDLGTGIRHPFGILSFLALPVIPDLKLTDRGLVDVKQFKFVDLFVRQQEESHQGRLKSGRRSVM